jgi:alpha-L-rhamnosidase
MNRLFFFLFFLGITQQLVAQDFFAKERKIWATKAEAFKPKLIETTKKPIRVVTMVKDEKAFQGWKIDKSQLIDSVFSKSFKKQSGVILDFGEHLTGYFSFDLAEIRGVADAPTRFKLTFGEVPAEINTPFDPYNQTMSRAWLQDEIVTVSEMPSVVTIPRRLSFRYVKIELLGSSAYFDFKIADAYCKATTSANAKLPNLSAQTSKIVSQIDQIAQNTLKECMQTVFEDGPKRDRRLWIGDLYLQSMANNQSFKNYNLTKRCLYLLASLCTEGGYLPSNVFERPTPHNQKGAPFLFEYSLIYTPILLDYLKATNDKATVAELWIVAKKQLDNPKKFLLDTGLFDSEAAAKSGWWMFVDWKEDLDKQAAIQGIIIMSLRKTQELAKLLGKEKEVSELPDLINKMTEAAKTHLFDASKGVFVSGKERQISYASQAWMVLANVVDNETGKKALKNALNEAKVVKPGGPYLMHYYVEAMIQVGMHEEAKNELVRYWGEMVQKEADTFWEVFDPKDDFISPYGFYPMNSYCHAWSCTPLYFIRKYPEIFQK